MPFFYRNFFLELNVDIHDVIMKVYIINVMSMPFYNYKWSLCKVSENDKSIIMNSKLKTLVKALCLYYACKAYRDSKTELICGHVAPKTIDF